MGHTRSRVEHIDTDVVVIGAGMAGTSAARALASGGLGVVVLEAGGRVGGRVWSIRDFAEQPVEAGAELVHGKAAATWGHVRAAGLRTVATPHRYSWFHLAGRTRWLPIHLLHPGVWRMFGILAALADPPDISAAELIERKGYRGRALEMAGLTLAAHLPGALDEIGVAGLVADGVPHLEGGLNHRVVSGYDTLPGHLATGLDIRFAMRARRIAYGPDGVEVTTTGGTTVRARAGVTTLPHGVLTRGDVEFDPGLPESKTSALERIASGAVTKLLLRFEDRFWPKRASQIVCGTGPVTLYWPTSFHTDGPPVLSAYATGPRAKALSDAGAEAALERVLDDLDRILPGSRARARLADWRFVDWMTDPNALGGYTFLRPGAIGARADLAAPTDALFWAGSATAWEPVAAAVEAAYLSGLRAAREVSDLLRASA